MRDRNFRQRTRPKLSTVAPFVGWVLSAVACGAEKGGTGVASEPVTPHFVDVDGSGHQCDLALGMCKLELDPATPPVCKSPPCLPPDQTTLAERAAEKVFARIQPDLLKCYTKREHQKPDPDFVTLVAIITPDGSVSRVEAEGGASLGEGGLRCLQERVRKEKFDPPYGGGTLRVHQSLTLRTLVPGAAPKAP